MSHRGALLLFDPQCGLADGHKFRGGIHAAVVPYGVAEISAPSHLRVAFLHWQDVEAMDASAAQSPQVHLSKTCPMQSVHDCVATVHKVMHLLLRQGQQAHLAARRGDGRCGVLWCPRLMASVLEEAECSRQSMTRLL